MVSTCQSRTCLCISSGRRAKTRSSLLILDVSLPKARGHGRAAADPSTLYLIISRRNRMCDWREWFHRPTPRRAVPCCRLSSHAAVRTDSATKLAPLKALGALGELDVVSGCDLLTPGSFDAAVASAEVCFHTASPFWMDGRISDPWAQLVHPAEKGTLNVLDACAKRSSSVRRVVLTSSFAASMNVGGNVPWPADFQYTEEHWNVSSAPDAEGAFPEPVNGHAYRWSKTVAEKAAWAHPATDGKFDLVTLMPPMVLGENKQTLDSVEDLNQSSLILYSLLAGKMVHVMPGSVGFVDVADVARAHVLGAQVASAGGQRYMCSGVTKTWRESLYFKPEVT